MKRLKPSFFFLGPTKTGTTSMFCAFNKHKQLTAPSNKEPQYFAHEFSNGLSWYLRQFPIDKNDCKLTYEASPSYFGNKNAGKRMIEQDFGDSKFIIFLRNPVDRIISKYRHFRSFNIMIRYDNPPNYVKDQLIRTPNWVGEDKNFQELIDSEENLYFGCSKYLLHLKKWFSYFDRDRFLIMDFRDIGNDFESVIYRIEDFLGLDRQKIDAVKRNHKDQWVAWRDEDSINLEQIEYLKEYFNPYNKALYEFMGKDYGWENDNIIV
jgi:hypothetical protein